MDVQVEFQFDLIKVVRASYSEKRNWSLRILRRPVRFLDFRWSIWQMKQRSSLRCSKQKIQLHFPHPRATYSPLDRDRALATMTLRGMKNAVIVKDMPE